MMYIVVNLIVVGGIFALFFLPVGIIGKLAERDQRENFYNENRESMPDKKGPDPDRYWTQD